MNISNGQRLVFTMLVATVLIEFGSFSKFQKVWQLAFTADTTGQTSFTQSNSQPTVSLGVPQPTPTTTPTPTPTVQL